MLSGCVFGVLIGLSSQSNAQSTRGLWIAGGAEVLRVDRTTVPAGGLGNFTSTTVAIGLYGGDVGIGYQFNDRFLFGGRFGFGIVSPENSDTVVAGHLGAHFEILFGAEKVRPFLLLEPGLEFVGNNSFTSRSNVGFHGQVGGGAHLFVTDSFSISPYGAFQFVEVPDWNRRTFALVVGAMISGWVWKK